MSAPLRSNFYLFLKDFLIIYRNKNNSKIKIEDIILNFNKLVESRRRGQKNYAPLRVAVKLGLPAHFTPLLACVRLSVYCLSTIAPWPRVLSTVSGEEESY